MRSSKNYHLAENHLIPVLTEYMLDRLLYGF